jgi:1-acyl-sn-glycerol-3-phosphate acyltransferase
MESIRAFFRITLLPLVRCIYNLRVRGADRVPPSGGVLLIANHVSYLDSFILYAACPRPLRFVIVSRYLQVGAIRWFLNLFGAIPITPGKSRDAIRVTAECLKRGDAVCIFPEGQLTRTGVMNELKKGFEIIARQSDAPVVPVYMHGLWGSIFSFERGHYFRKWPRSVPWPVVVAFGHPEPAESADIAWASHALRAASVEAFDAMPQFDYSLAEAIVRGLKKNRTAPCLIEHGKSVRRLGRHQVLATATALARRWRETLDGDDPRVGIYLPGGTAPSLLNLGLILAGRVPVNLPFPGRPQGTLDVQSAADTIRGAGLRTVITARAFSNQLSAASGMDDLKLLDFSTELAGIGIGRLFVEKLRAFCEPAWLACLRLRLPGDSTWEVAMPGGKIRAFSGRQILAETLRLGSGNWIETGETIACEFDLTSLTDALWTLWLPVLRVQTLAGRAWASRNDPSLIESLCLTENVQRLVLKPADVDEWTAGDEPWHPELRVQLRSVLVPVAAISDATGLHLRSDRVSSKTGAPLCPYWAPDGGGIVAISQPDADPDPLPLSFSSQPGRRESSPGRLLPGLAIPENVTLDESGFLM